MTMGVLDVKACGMIEGGRVAKDQKSNTKKTTLLPLAQRVAVQRGETGFQGVFLRRLVGKIAGHV